MSRIGKSPIPMPSGVTYSADAGVFKVKGPKGELTVPFNKELSIKQDGDQLLVERPSDAQRHRALHGLTRSLVFNAVKGVSDGFTINLELRGVGYRAKLNGRALELTIGYSHPVVIQPPEGVTFTVPEPTKIDVSGIDKQLVGQVAANVRKVRKPDAYHGKGVRFLGEKIALKAGKAGATGGKGKK
ncbi:50S ribosomal protein L6 [Deinococcus radiopugnans]|jgi:large subunit ribosomal protein L6|uniref:Large ribosomal subunit protein uL6 n=2 Tax=Deinococcus radiopugnans TaxID=57497 RepID=A0A0A7KEU9_9DEIO|nr:50S ribosomal protein L6 [Deinococcus radiopugnans]AIZ44671.1 50S ribosomal protein L6 [Deinococcus radiopugnans]MBB6015005.1 large subunit ribosomal protein L6 [Deinococcus radiopugnans ATCC 19172]QLG10288.1 50S ribosomal protein L6 [Deinococcus sp. D7000]TNM71011.1 50S ribosomal protein L6 [Deinococcus radiopugnans ATCC 19172]